MNTYLAMIRPRSLFAARQGMSACLISSVSMLRKSLGLEVCWGCLAEEHARIEVGFRMTAPSSATRMVSIVSGVG